MDVAPSQWPWLGLGSIAQRQNVRNWNCEVGRPSANEGPAGMDSTELPAGRQTNIGITLDVFACVPGLHDDAAERVAPPVFGGR